MKIKLLVFFLFISALHYGQDLNNDSSKVLDNYYKAGIPFLNRDWTSEEFIKSINIVLDQSNSKLLELPSHNNNSIYLLNKLTDYNEYWFLRSHTYAENSKFDFTLNFGNSLSKLLVKYMKQGDNDQKLIYSFESVKCYIALLKILTKNIEYAENILKQNPELSDIQKDGLAKMKHGTSTVLSGCFITLQNDYKYYNVEDICELSPVIFGFYKKNRSFIGQESRNEFDQKIILIRKEHPLECVKKAAVLN